MPSLKVLEKGNDSSTKLFQYYIDGTIVTFSSGSLFLSAMNKYSDPLENVTIVPSM